MKDVIENRYGSERSVETDFAKAMLWKYAKSIGDPYPRFQKILDVGGVPTHHLSYGEMMLTVEDVKARYEIADFRGGKYQGDFVTMDIPEKFDIVMFISSLEHFPQCTEGDLKFREGEDRKGFLKALEILEVGGKILLTVPFGKHHWQEYHQNYDMAGIRALTEGSHLLESFTYRLVDGQWIAAAPSSMEDIRYTDRAYGVGCFVLEKV